jgi:hypothetical protein
MRIEGEGSFVEFHPIEAGEGEFDVRASVGDFSGRNPHVWIDAGVLRQFVDDLRVVERDRRGKAHLEAMSPNEFELTISVVDSAGHAAVSGSIGRIVYVGREHRTLVFKFNFSLDPASLPQLTRDAAQFVGAG